MARQGKKGKNELDIILEQLKKSYGSESSDTLEDDLLETESFDDDSELNEILSKIFDNDDQDENETTEEISTESSTVDDQSDAEDLIASSEDKPETEPEGYSLSKIAEAEESSDDEIEIGHTEDNFANDDEIQAVSEEEPTDTSASQPCIDIEASEQVDQVINMMFSKRDNRNDDEGPISSDTDTSTAPDEEKIDNEEDIDIEGVVPDEFEEDINCSEHLTNEGESEDIIYEDPNSDGALLEHFDDGESNDTESSDADSDSEFDDESDDEDEFVILLSADSDNQNSENDNFAIEDEEYDVSDDEDEVSDFDISSNDIQSKEATDISINNNIADIVFGVTDTQAKPRFILSSNQYIHDPLQSAVPSFNLPGYDDAEDENSNTGNQLIDLSKFDNVSFDNNDISLLLKLGYDNEIKTKVGNQKAQEIMVEQENDFKSGKYKKPFGYCGEELYNKAQFSKIRDKYRSNKLTCIFLLTLVSIISLFMLSLDIFFVFYSDRIEFFTVAVIFEISFILLICLFLHRKIISGITGIIKFEADSSSILSALFVLYIIYQATALILYITNFPEIKENELLLFGFGVSVYAVLNLVSDLINCIREASAFNIISTSDKLFVAEKQNYLTSPEKTNVSKKNNTYKIKKASLISGYFKKTTKNTYERFNVILIIGIIPVLAFAVGCTVALISKSILLGLSIMMMTVLLCAPISSACFPAIFNFVTSKWLKRYSAALIGTDAAEEYVAADTLIFNDTDAVAVSAYTEIRPGKCSDTHDTLEIAYQVFKTLNGPLSKACEAQIGSIYNADHALVINEISDNGIDIYYDNAINILIGDKYFMKAHKIKVKTDTNLTAAVKGLDRSVIYLAFNGVPKLGFIISSKVNNSFIQITHALEEACIKVMVETYEPQINQIYFEQNMGPNSPPVGVIKPDTYDDENLDSVCNSGIVSSADSISVAKSILLSRDIVKHKKSLKLIERAVMIGEIVLAMVLASICCFNAQYGILQGIFNNIISIFYTAMFLGATPGIIKLILINRRHTAKHKQNGDKKQK